MKKMAPLAYHRRHPPGSALSGVPLRSVFSNFTPHLSESVYAYPSPNISLVHHITALLQLLYGIVDGALSLSSVVEVY